MSQTDEGWLHKAVEVEGQLHIIEELQVFDEEQPVTSVLVSGKLVALQTLDGTKWVLSLRRLDRFFSPPLPLPRRACTWAPRRVWRSFPSPTVTDTLPATTASLPGTRTVPGTEASVST